MLRLPGVVFLEVAASAAAAATRPGSFVENMRVKRSLTEAFSEGFGNCSAELVGPGWPFWAARCGDLEERSKDLMDDVCEGEVRCEDADLASEVLLAMVADFRGGRVPGRSVGVIGGGRASALVVVCFCAGRRLVAACNCSDCRNCSRRNIA